MKHIWLIITILWVATAVINIFVGEYSEASLQFLIALLCADKYLDARREGAS